MNNSNSSFSLIDIHNFLSSSSTDVTNSVIHIDEIIQKNYNLDNIFSNNFSIIVFIPNPNSDDNLSVDDISNIGHFVLLSDLDENMEYFDSYAISAPESIVELCRINNKNLIQNTVSLQSKTSYICAKYCLARMYSLPTSLKDFCSILTNNKKFTPDEIIDKLFILKYK